MTVTQVNPLAPATPEQRQQVNHATQMSIVGNLADSFLLSDEEIDLVTVRVKSIVGEFENHAYQAIPAGAKNELEQRSSSRRIQEIRDGRFTARLATEEQAKQASVDDWAFPFAEMLDNMYGFDGFTRARVVAEFKALMRDIGVENPRAPRASRFLPSTVRNTIRSMA